MGGAATNSGINYQQRIAALALASQYSGFDLSNTFGINAELVIETIHFESNDPIDDLKLSCKGSREVFLQIKRNISLEVDSSSDFYKTVKQFVEQQSLNSSQNENYVLATSSNSSRTITQELSKICESIRLNPNSFRKNPLSKTEDETLKRFESVFTRTFQEVNGKVASEESFIAFGKRTYISIIDIEQGRPNEQVALILLRSKGLIDPILVWNSLIANCLEYARKRQSIGDEALSEILDRYIVDTEEIEEDEHSELAKYFQTEIINKGDFPVGKEVLLIHSFIDEYDLLIAEMFRFNDSGKIKHQFQDKSVRLFGTDEKWEIVYRSATMSGITRYMTENAALFQDKKIGIVPANDIEGVEDSAFAKLHQKYLISLQEKNLEILRCLHCDKALNPAKSILIEVDDLDTKPAVGAVHPKCVRVIDRVMGITAIPSKRKVDDYLEDFDYKEWARLLMKGQGMVNQLKHSKLTDGQEAKVFWSSENKSLRNFSYCLKHILADGSVIHVTDRGRIHRFSKKEAELAQKQMSDGLARMVREGSPMGYTSKNLIFGPKEKLIELKDPDEKFIEIKQVEIDRYSKLLEKQDHLTNFYAPICLVRSKEDETILTIGPMVPLISDPLEFGKIYETWNHIGHNTPTSELELLIIGSDADFDMYMRDFFADDMRPVVDPIFLEDKSLVSGLEIQHMQRQIAMRSAKSRIKISNPKWKKGDRIKVLHPAVQDGEYPLCIIVEDEFKGEDGELYVLMRPIEAGEEDPELAFAIPSRIVISAD